MTTIIRGNDNFDTADAAPGGGLATAWAKFQGTGVATINGSSNVTSITDNGVGNYSFTLTNALSTIDVATVCSSGNNAASGGRNGTAWMNSTSELRVIGFNSASHVLEDHDGISVAVFGGKN